MKKNEGFSLVELIVVVAIMAVLIGILAPAYLGYVEKTRKGTDENACEEIRGCIEKAIAGDLAVYDGVVDQMSGTPASCSFTIADNATISTSCTLTVKSGATSYVAGTLNSAIADTFGTKALSFKSKEYNGCKCIVTVTSAGGNATEVGVAIYAADGTTLKKTIK